jgi:hypothetical protein
MRKSQPEVVVRLSSGLGNQLFQLARGMSLSEQKNARLCYDTTWFPLVSNLHPVKRQLRLPELSVTLPEAFHGFRRLAIGVLAAYFDKTRQGQPFLSTLGRMQVVQEGPSHLRYEDEIAEITADRIYLNGYWQTGTPFTLVRDKLLAILRPRSPLSQGAKAFIAKAESGNSGFIHVRRGDYIHFVGENGVLPVSYYSTALAKLQDMGKKVSRWIIFSEDMEWARINLGFVPHAEIVDYQSHNRDIEDLMIMQACSAGIIANSSYSWWGAAIGDHPDRLIVTPDRYWAASALISEGWALPNWVSVRAWD